jgi:TolB-like protein
MSLFEELKRRNVFRMAGLYVVGAWLVTQVAGTVLPMFGAPDWIGRSLVVLLAIGFVPTMLFSWIYELTPEGLKRESEIDRDTSITSLTARRIDRSITVVLVLALAYFAVDKFMLAPARNARDIASAVDQAGAASASKAGSSATSAASASAASAATAGEPSIPSIEQDPSIAVLPLQDLSQGKDQEYFSDGITEELLDLLAKVPKLRVIARTSSFSYKGKDTPIADIARVLHVAAVLEGSVRKSGQKVRITVQLIRASDSSHLWSETYDRTLDDIFAVESEVAQKIAESLAAKLTSGERAALARKPTENALAYAAYLKARAYSSIVETQQEADRKLAAYRDALTADPGFALAWAEFSREASRTAWVGFDPSGTLFKEAAAALDRAKALAPDLPQAEMARGVYLYYATYDYAGAYAIINGVKRDLPGDADVWLYSGLLARRIGKWQESADDLSHAWTLAPNDPYIGYHLGTTWASIHRCDRAIPFYDASLALRPGDAASLGMKLLCVLTREGVAGVARELAALPGDTPSLLAQRAILALYQRDYAAASNLYRKALASATDLQIDTNFNGYLPAAIEWQLQYALAEQRAGVAERARELYEQTRTRAQSALAGKPTNKNVEAAWHAALGVAFAGLGLGKEAEQEGRTLVALIPEAVDTLEGPTWADYQARIFAMNGNADAALASTAHLLATNSSYLSPAQLRVDPAWDPVRTDPRFDAMLKEADVATEEGRQQR